jgi:hypothetical protein
MRRPAAGGSPEEVLEEPADMSWQYWCPFKTGSSCVLSQREGSSLVFYSLDPSRGKGESLGKIDVSVWDYLGWNVSPDGSRVAQVEQGHEGRIEVLTLSDRAWHEVSVEPGWGSLQSIAWAADAKGFFVTSWLPDSFNLLYVTLAGKVEPLLRNGHRQWMIHPLPSPDGKHLAFQAQTWDSNAWLSNAFESLLATTGLGLAEQRTVTIDKFHAFHRITRRVGPMDARYLLISVAIRVYVASPSLRDRLQHSQFPIIPHIVPLASASVHEHGVFRPCETIAGPAVNLPFRSIQRSGTLLTILVDV